MNKVETLFTRERENYGCWSWVFLLPQIYYQQFYVDPGELNFFQSWIDVFIHVTDQICLIPPSPTN